MSSSGFSVTGDVSIKPLSSITDTGGRIKSFWVLILGPTGAGKSSFIEALAGKDQSLGISKDQLAGFTQEVTVYEVKNATITNNYGFPDTPIFLIDTPGFSDSKTSDLEIMTKVRRWMSEKGIYEFDLVLYFSPITDTRATRSKRRTIKMLQSLLWNRSYKKWNPINIVTTMWDTLSNQQAKKRAEANLAQLGKDIWQYPVNGGAKIFRFYNTHDSAIHIMQRWFEIQYITMAPTGLASDTLRLLSGGDCAPYLYEELLERISSAQQEKEFLLQEKIQLIAEPDALLEPWVLSRIPEVENKLANYLDQLTTFGMPPRGFEGKPENCIYQNLLDHINETREEWAALKDALARLDTDRDSTRKMALEDRLHVVESELVQHVNRLVDHGSPPKGYETALQHTLEGVSHTSRNS